MSTSQVFGLFPILRLLDGQARLGLLAGLLASGESNHVLQAQARILGTFTS